MRLAVPIPSLLASVSSSDSSSTDGADVGGGGTSEESTASASDEGGSPDGAESAPAWFLAYQQQQAKDQAVFQKRINDEQRRLRKALGETDREDGSQPSPPITAETLKAARRAERAAARLEGVMEADDFQQLEDQLEGMDYDARALFCETLAKSIGDTRPGGRRRQGTSGGGVELPPRERNPGRPSREEYLQASSEQRAKWAAQGIQAADIMRDGGGGGS